MTEDCSNDAEKSALITAINYILKYIQTESFFQIVITFHIIIVYCTFDQIHAALISIKVLAH